MKHLLAVFAVAGLLIALVPDSAYAWYCRADSPRAYGWGRAGSLYRAKRIALYQCAIRTPRWQTCYISWCR
jgi:hypothetical protein